MSVEKVVLNASPLILLCNGELDFILPELFGEIVVPNAVWQEIMSGSYPDRTIQQLPQVPWLTKQEVTLVADVIHWDLGAGETAVLSFAAQNSDYTPVLDDMLAKQCAKSIGLQTIGTGTLLILAKERGLIHSVGEALQTLQNVGLWISQAVVQMLKQQAGE